MIMSQLAVLALSLALVCCAKRIDRTEPTPLYPVRGTVVDSMHALPILNATVGTARDGSRTCRLRGEHRVPVDSVGSFTLLLPAGRHHVCAEAIGFIARAGDRKSTRLNSSHVRISYAVFCLKKKKIGQAAG